MTMGGANLIRDYIMPTARISHSVLVPIIDLFVEWEDYCDINPTNIECPAAFYWKDYE